MGRHTRHTGDAMNRRKFMKQSLVAGVAASGALRLEANDAFVTPVGAGRIVTLAAKAAPISLDLAKTVVMVVDMQNDFASKGGSFDRDGFDLSIIKRAIPPTAKVLSAARAAGLKIIYLKFGFRPDLSAAGELLCLEVMPTHAEANYVHLNTGNGDVNELRVAGQHP